MSIDQTSGPEAARRAREEGQGKRQQFPGMTGEIRSDKHPETSLQQVGKERE